MTSSTGRLDGHWAAAAVRAGAAARRWSGPARFVAGCGVVAETGSTNDDLAEAARAGAPEGCVLVAEEQTRGRGRLDRAWTSPPRAGLTVLGAAPPAAGVPVSRRTWLPLLAGLAVQQAVARLGAVPSG